jgi:hypothetical protein
MKAKLKLLVLLTVAVLPNGVKILLYRKLFGANIGPACASASAPCFSSTT